MNSIVKKRTTRTSPKTDELPEWLSNRKNTANVGEAAIAALQLKWGCSRETAAYIQTLEDRVRYMQESREPLDVVSKLHMPKL